MYIRVVQVPSSSSAPITSTRSTRETVAPEGALARGVWAAPPWAFAVILLVAVLVPVAVYLKRRRDERAKAPPSSRRASFPPPSARGQR